MYTFLIVLVTLVILYVGVRYLYSYAMNRYNEKKDKEQLRASYEKFGPYTSQLKYKWGSTTAIVLVNDEYIAFNESNFNLSYIDEFEVVFEPGGSESYYVPERVRSDAAVLGGMLAGYAWKGTRGALLGGVIGSTCRETVMSERFLRISPSYILYIFFKSYGSYFRIHFSDQTTADMVCKFANQALKEYNERQKMIEEAKKKPPKPKSVIYIPEYIRIAEEKRKQLKQRRINENL